LANTVRMDRFDVVDRAILRRLQIDGRVPNNELADGESRTASASSLLGTRPSICSRRRIARSTASNLSMRTVFDEMAFPRNPVVLWIALALHLRSACLA